MNRKEFIRLIGASLLAIIVLYELGCSKADQQPRIDFYIDISNGNVSSTDGSSNFQLPNYYQELYITGESVNVNGLIVFKGVDGFYYALSQSCPNDGCDVEYEVFADRLHCPCDGSLFNIDGTVLMGPVTIPLYRYAATLSGSLLHVYTP